MRAADREFYFADPKTKKKIFVKEWNPQEEKVVLFFHGFPGCAEQASLMASSPHFQSIRLISVDRPGYGNSDHQKKLKPLEFARQLIQVLDEMQIEKLHILSVSGGAPFGMALAHLLQDRVVKICSIGGVAPVTRKNFKYMNPKQKKAWFMIQMLPLPVAQAVAGRIWKKNEANLQNNLFTNMGEFSEADQKVFDHPEISPVLKETFMTALKQGPHGIIRDLRVYARNWGFSMDDISCPVTLWHGTKDDVVHIEYANDMKLRLKNAQLKVIPEEGHYSISMNYRDEIIADLVGATL